MELGTELVREERLMMTEAMVKHTAAYYAERLCSPGGLTTLSELCPEYGSLEAMQEIAALFFENMYKLGYHDGLRGIYRAIDPVYRNAGYVHRPMFDVGPKGEGIGNARGRNQPEVDGVCGIGV